MRKTVAILGPVLVMAYLMVAISPLRTALGRTHPKWATFFSAPTFNFHETYTTGKVLGFRIGMDTQEFAAAAETYIDSVRVQIPCDGPYGEHAPRVAHTPQRNPRAALSQLQCDDVIFHFRSSRLSMMFHFTQERIESITIWFITLELI